VQGRPLWSPLMVRHNHRPVCRCSRRTFPTCKAEMKMHALLDLRGNHTGKGRGRHTRPPAVSANTPGAQTAKCQIKGIKKGTAQTRVRANSHPGHVRAVPRGMPPRDAPIPSRMTVVRKMSDWGGAARAPPVGHREFLLSTGLGTLAGSTGAHYRAPQSTEPPLCNQPLPRTDEAHKSSPSLPHR